MSGPDYTKLPRGTMTLVPLALLGLFFLIYYHVADWKLLYVGDSFHDRMVHRLEIIGNRVPIAGPILVEARDNMEAAGLQIVRFDEESPAIRDRHKEHMARWPRIQGMVVWNDKQVIMRLGKFEQWEIALGLEDGQFLDRTLLHEMVHVAYGEYDFEFDPPSIFDAEDQLYLCLDDSQFPTCWKIFERNLEEELVAYLAEEIVMEGRGWGVSFPEPGDLANPNTHWGKQYEELMDFLIPECFTRGFFKSLVGWSPHFTDEENFILRDRVEKLRNSEMFRNKVIVRLKLFGLIPWSINKVPPSETSDIELLLQED